MDCIEAMKQMPDDAFDLAVVDPPYGIEKGFQATSRIAKYGQMDSVNDAKPSREYFTELFRVSKTKSYGAIIICQLYYHQRRSLYFGISINLLNPILTVNLRGLPLQKRRNALIILSLAARVQMMMVVFIQLKSQLHCTDGFISTTRSRVTRFWTRISALVQAGLPRMMQG